MSGEFEIIKKSEDQKVIDFEDIVIKNKFTKIN
jgi:hypothetical protein